MNLLCKLFGHKYYQGKMTIAFNFTVRDKHWHEIWHDMDILICQRCHNIPMTGKVTIGEKDAHIEYSPHYAVDSLKMFVENVE